MSLKRPNNGRPNQPKAMNKDSRLDAVVLTTSQRQDLLAELTSTDQIRTSNIKRFQKITSAVSEEVLQTYLKELKVSPNTRLSNPLLRQHFEKCLRSVYCKETILFSIDVEAWERETNFVTEIGLSIYDPRNQLASMIPSFKQVHIRIRENFNKLNGRFVPDHSQNSINGTSYVMTKKETVKFVQVLIDFYFNIPSFPAALVGHGVTGDIKWFSNLGISFPPNFKIVDTQMLYSLTKGEQGSSLKKALRKVDIPYAFLHNAFNDAYYTLVLAMKLCDPNCRVLYQLDAPKGIEEPSGSTRRQQKQKAVSEANLAEVVETSASELVVSLFL